MFNKHKHFIGLAAIAIACALLGACAWDAGGLDSVVAAAVALDPVSSLELILGPAVPVVAATMTPDEVRAAVLESLGKHTSELSAKIAEVEAQAKSTGKVSDETKAEIAALSEKGKEIEGKVATELKRIGDLEARLQAAEQKIVAGVGPGGRRSEKSLGERFVESPELKGFAEKFKAESGKLEEMRKFRGRSEEMRVGTFSTKDITSVAGSGGSGIWSERQPEIVSEPYRPLTIRNLIPVIPVSSNLIEYVRTLARTNNADIVSEGGTKPKSDLTYQRAETAVRKIAHYIKASMEVLADFPRLQNIVNTELLQMLKIVEEDQLLLGDGTGDSILGLIPQATAYDTALNRVGDTRLDVIRHAILQVRESFYPSTGIVMSPRDWERLELTKDNEGRYIVATATAVTGPRLWGLPVIESDAMPTGQFMVGSFALAAEIYDRMVAAIFVSTEDGNNFIENMVSILAEERLGLAVKRPLAFVHGDFTDAGLSSGA